jgi:hypothetical protein
MINFNSYSSFGSSVIRFDGKVTKKREKRKRKARFSFHFRVLSKFDAVKVTKKITKYGPLFLKNNKMELLFPVFGRLVCAICRIFANFAHETREVNLFRRRKRDIPV